jgi:hypothetical protein
MTLPRMAGVEWSCSSELAVAMKTTLAAPIGTSTSSASGSEGAGVVELWGHGAKVYQTN